MSVSTSTAAPSASTAAPSAQLTATSATTNPMQVRPTAPPPQLPPDLFNIKPFTPPQQFPKNTPLQQKSRDERPLQIVKYMELQKRLLSQMPK